MQQRDKVVFPQKSERDNGKVSIRMMGGQVEAGIRNLAATLEAELRGSKYPNECKRIQEMNGHGGAWVAQ